MRAVPIPNDVVKASGGIRVVLGEPGDPTRDDVRPCEYVVLPSHLYPGRSSYTALIEVNDTERDAIASGAQLSLTLDGGEVPWSLEIHPNDI